MIYVNYTLILLYINADVCIINKAALLSHKEVTKQFPAK